MSALPLDQIRAFLEAHAHPLEREFLSRPFRELVPKLAELRAEVKRQGLWAPHLPRAMGGLGLPLPEFGEVSAVKGYTPDIFMTQSLVGMLEGKVRDFCHHIVDRRLE